MHTRYPNCCHMYPKTVAVFCNWDYQSLLYKHHVSRQEVREEHQTFFKNLVLYRNSLGTDLFGTFPSSFNLLCASLMWQGLIGPDSFLSAMTILAAKRQINKKRASMKINGMLSHALQKHKNKWIQPRIVLQLHDSNFQRMQLRMHHTTTVTSSMPVISS